MNNAAMSTVMTTVQLPNETIRELCLKAAYAARVLEDVRQRLGQHIDGRSRVPAAEVLERLDAEIEGYRAAADPDSWRRSIESGVMTPQVKNRIAEGG
jgi:hypothetical protein